MSNFDDIFESTPQNDEFDKVEKELQKLLDNLPIDTQIHESKDYFNYE